KLGRVVLDGSKVKGNASKHKAMSYGRMQEDEKRLQAEVKRLLEQAEKVDAEEDARYGRERSGDELPAELARRETRLERIREAKRALEAGTGAGQEEGPAGGRGEARGQDAIQLYRSGIAHHERGKRLCPGLQRAGRGRAQLPVDRRPAGDARRQRQTTDAASGRGDPRAIRTE